MPVVLSRGACKLDQGQVSVMLGTLTENENCTDSGSGDGEYTVSFNATSESTSSLPLTVTQGYLTITHSSNIENDQVPIATAPVVTVTGSQTNGILQRDEHDGECCL